MEKRIYKDKISKLRSKERLDLLEVERVVELTLEKIYITKILDVGTGSGIFAEAYALRNFNATGIDKNPQMVKIASDLVQDAHFKEASAEALPFKDDTFDLVFLGHILHESDDPALVLKEAFRVATQRIAILEWPYRSENIGPPMQHRMPPETIQSLLRKTGFKNIQKTNLTHLVLFRAWSAK